jgi:hypothetical protein
MNQTQLERIKTELKRRFYEQNKIGDIFAIIYRFQGVAEKIPETQEIVLDKRIKLGVRSVKERGWIGSRESDRSKGFLQFC